jgi:hypothetical protein
MTEFPALREALHTWALDVASTFADDSEVHYQEQSLPRWECDPDGIFRNISRPAEVWNFKRYQSLRDLDRWQGVETAFHEDGRLNRQVDIFVGTIQGGGQLGIFGLAMHVLPRPDDLGRTSEVFEERYAELERYLTADDLEFKTLWPVPGLIVGNLPVELGTDVALDTMSNSEVAIALRSGIVRPIFPNDILFQAEPAIRTCIRYRFSLSKLVGPRPDDASEQFQELEQRLQDIHATIEESLTLTLPDPIMVAGRFGVSGELWSPLAGGVSFHEAMMPRHARWRRIEVDDRGLSELKEVCPFTGVGVRSA